MADNPPPYQETVKAPAGVYQPQSGYGAVPQAGYPPSPGQSQPAGYAPLPSQGGYAPLPQTGYPPAPPQPPSPSYQYSTTFQQPTGQRVVVVGGCPACRVGMLEDDFTCLGVLCAILFFPLGILCCLAMRQRRCAHCGAVFG